MQKNNQLWVVCYLLSWGVIASCQPSSQPSEKKSSPASQSQAIASEQIKVKYARNFRVKYFDHYKVVTVTKAFSDQDDSLRYALVQRGHKAPKEFKPNQVIEIPVHSLITLSTTHVALADMLGITKSITGNAGNQYISEKSSLAPRIKQGQVAEVGSSKGFNKELVLSLQPDMLMMSGVFAADYQKHQTTLGGNTCLVVNTEWLEQHPLARAEWVKFLALFYNKEKMASQKFQEIEAKYKEIKQQVTQVTQRPTVFGGIPYKGAWYVARGESYLAQFIKDAGADYLWKDTQGTGSMPLDFETVFAKAHASNYWLNVGQAQSLPGLLSKDERFAKFAAFQKGKIYNNNRQLNKNGGNDYWTTGLVNPHLILADLVKIFHPDLLPQHQLVYYKKLSAHEGQNQHSTTDQ